LNQTDILTVIIEDVYVISNNKQKYQQLITLFYRHFREAFIYLLCNTQNSK